MINPEKDALKPKKQKTCKHFAFSLLYSHTYIKKYKIQITATKQVIENFRLHPKTIRKKILR